MKRNKMIISLAGLVIAVATATTVAVYTLAGDGSGTPANESVGNNEPAFQDDKLPTFDPGPGQISDDGGSVPVTNPAAQGSIGIPDPSGQTGTLVQGDHPPAGKVVPIGKFDGDVGPAKDPGVPDVQVLPPRPNDAPEPPVGEPIIEPVDSIAVGEPSPAQGMPVPIDPDEYAQVVELAKLDMGQRFGLEDTGSIELRKVSKKVSKVEWGNTPLGNPQPGMGYAEVIVPEFVMLLESDSAVSIYHASLEEAVFVEGTAVSHPVDGQNLPVSDDESGKVVEVVRVLTPIEDVEDPDGQSVRAGRGTVQLIDPLLATGADVKVTHEVVENPSSLWVDASFWWTGSRCK